MQLFCVGGLAFLYLIQDYKISFLKLLGDYSFGIFFVHLYILQVFRLLDRGHYINISPPTLITFLLYFALVISLTVGIVKVVKVWFKNNSRYLIGS
jgi:peptidoglycan/LPS O-acetylase OafA/YrhL